MIYNPNANISTFSANLHDSGDWRGAMLLDTIEAHMRCHTKERERVEHDVEKDTTQKRKNEMSHLVVRKKFFSAGDGHQCFKGRYAPEPSKKPSLHCVENELTVF